MTRRFDIGPLLVALGALVLLVGLFLDWYGGVNAWNSFELADVVLAALAAAGLVAGAAWPPWTTVRRRRRPARR